MNGTHCAPRTLAPRSTAPRSVERRPTASNRLLVAEAARLELGHLWSRGAAGRALVAIGAARAAVGASSLVAGTYALL